MNASFVIPYVKMDQLLEKTIESVKAQQTRYNFEIILVNNGPDENPSIPGVSVCRCNTRGASAARNAGARLAQGKYLAFIDSDVVLERNWLEEGLGEILRSPRIAAVQSPVISAPLSSEDPSFLDRYRYTYKETITQGTFLFMNRTNIIVNTAACLIQKDIFWLVHGFDERLLRAEDRHLTLKLLAKGYFLSTTMLTSSRVYNNKGLWGFMFKYYRQGIDDRRINLALGGDGQQEIPPLQSNDVGMRLYRRLCMFFFHLGPLKKEPPIDPIKFSPSLLNPMLGLAPTTLLVKGARELLLVNTKTQQLIALTAEPFDWKFPINWGHELSKKLRDDGFI
ncbi:MAG TPA: glycosyltransferase family 2 protein [Bacteriovoracaceae bacterium]|nr:glycosyltransferase family 2 protein [Bacteriovoracaceae bacterium]